MPLDEFWNGPMEHLEAYRKAYYMDLHNTGHINGMYVGRAVASCLSDKEEYPKVNLYQEALDNEKDGKINKKKTISNKLQEAGSIKKDYLERLKREQQKRGD